MTSKILTAEDSVAILYTLFSRKQQYTQSESWVHEQSYKDDPRLSAKKPQKFVLTLWEDHCIITAKGL
jgi:hypothetical protein